jgi:hypothetical protein
MAQVMTLERPPTAPRAREAPASLTLPKRGRVKAATSQSTENAGGQMSNACSTTQSIHREGTGSGTLKPDPGKSSTPIDRAKARGSWIPSPNPKMKWNSPPLLKLRTNMGKGVSEASSDATIPARRQLTQVQVMLVDEKPNQWWWYKMTRQHLR